jgi:hypothetical protein
LLGAKALIPGSAFWSSTWTAFTSGGYYWVIFTTRRAYGNVAQGDPYETNTYSPITHPVTKKLWVAALDENPTAGKDPSHPAFYLPRGAEKLTIGIVDLPMASPKPEGGATHRSCEPFGRRLALSSAGHALGARLPRVHERHMARYERLSAR